MKAAIRNWWDNKRLAWAKGIIERVGLTAVKLHVIAGTTYVVKIDGSYWKLTKGKK